MKEMKEKIYDARTGMEYILIGDYYLPALKVPRLVRLAVGGCCTRRT